MSLTPSSERIESDTGESLTNALDLPDGRISRLIIVSLSYSRSFFSKNGFKLWVSKLKTLSITLFL